MGSRVVYNKGHMKEVRQRAWINLTYAVKEDARNVSTPEEIEKLINSYIRKAKKTASLG